MSHITRIALIPTAVIVLVVVFFIALPPAKPPLPTPTENKLNVIASFYPLAYLAQEIGGPNVEVTNITPAGVEPHDFEPTPRDLNNVYAAHLFLFNGGGIDTWAEKIQPDLQRQSTEAINMFSEIKSVIDNFNEFDPHIWLDPTILSKQADIVAEALSRIDPAHAEEYTTSRDRLKNELATLDTEYQTGLANCELREIVASHDAFGYLAQRYNFNVLHILGLSPEEEPSPKKIAEISELAKNKGIKHIFFEALVSPKLSQTIASEIGAQTLILNPLEGLGTDDIKTNQNYISIMRQNLANLKLAMVCQNNQSLK